MEAPGGQGVRDGNLSHSHTMMGIHITHWHGKLCTLADEPGANALGMWVLDDYSDPTSWRLQRKIDYYYSCGAAGAALDDDPHAAPLKLFVPASRQPLWWRFCPMVSMAMMTRRARKSCSSLVTRRSCTMLGARRGAGGGHCRCLHAA
uniref:Uncharacterized protein n=1 Tax=Oryza barthii TaxID=65489 RepID=A0A0D3FIU5_9ORYZ